MMYLNLLGGLIMQYATYAFKKNNIWMRKLDFF